MIINLEDILFKSEKSLSSMPSVPSNTYNKPIRSLTFQETVQSIDIVSFGADTEVIGETGEGGGGKNPVTFQSCCTSKYKEKDVQNKYKVKHVYQHALGYYSLQSKIKRTDNVYVDLGIVVSGKYKPKNKSEQTFSASKYAFDREINIRPYNNALRCLVSFTLYSTFYYKESGALGYTTISLDPISC